MEGFSPFTLFAFALISALLAMAVLKAVRAPTLPAYFIVGVIVGPNGAGVMESSEAAHYVGELGIILLLFTIGLKFNLSTLRSIRDYVFVLGSMQVAVTTFAIAIPAWFLFEDVFIASLVGFVAAMSSTAIISQLLLENNAVASPVGRRAIGVLLLQDLVVIPLIIIYSNQTTDQSLAVTVLILAVKIALVLWVVLRIAPKLMHLWLDWISKYGDRELFIINLVAIISLFSALTGLFGLSYVLGAFLAGILISETFHRHRVEQIIEPFRQLFLGFFFITLGVLINPELLLDNAGMILVLTIALLAIKYPIVYGCMRITKVHQVTSARAAFMLGGTGEFGFVLLAVAQQSEVISDDLFQLLVPVNMLAMLVLPLFWKPSEKVIRRMFPDDWKHDQRRLQTAAAKTQHLSDHIIICGFGRTGQAVCGILRTIGEHNFVAIEEDHMILKAAGDVEQVVYGGSDSAGSLTAVGVERARAMIITYYEPISAAISVQNARQLNPSIYIIAKVDTTQQARAIREIGADEVVVDAHEAGFTLAERSLRNLESKLLWMLPHAAERARARKNPFFLGEYSGMLNAGEGDDEARRLLGVPVTGGRQPLTLQDMPANVEVVAWRRAGADQPLDDKTAVIELDDQLVLLGEEEALKEAKGLLGG